MAAIFLMPWINVSPTHYKESFLKNKINLGLILFYLVQVISVLFSADKADGFDILRVRMSLFILPVAFCLIDFEQVTWRKILGFYVLIATVASVAGFIYGIYMAKINHNLGYLYNDNISWLLLGKQAAYFGLYVNVAIFSIVYLLNHTKEHKLNFTIFLYSSLVWLIFINYMLASKMTSISMIVVLVGISFWQTFSKKKVWQGLLLLGGFVVGIFVLYELFPTVMIRYEIIAKTNFKFDNTNGENHFDSGFNEKQWNSSSTRVALWQCGKEIWENKPILGTGLGDLRNALKTKYTEKNFWFALNTKRNLHSQYMDVLVSMGIVGLLVFIFVFILYPAKIFITKKQVFALSIFAFIALCMLTENIFDRYQGEVLIALILPLSAKVLSE
jgi:O-antigen ligase